MTATDTLNEQFGLQGAVRFEEGPGGLTRMWVDITTGQAEIYLQGAHVARWQPATAVHPVLFMSEKTQYAHGKPLRGGIPVIFPWFGDRSDGMAGPAHGFVRTMDWTVAATERRPDGVGLSFRMLPSQQSRDYGFGDFLVMYDVVVGKTLELTLRVENPGDAPLRFEEALHAYFAVSDIAQVRVQGLDGASYLDKTDGMQRKTQTGAIQFERETDRLFVGTSAPVTIEDPGWRRSLVIDKRHSASTVVWNPWTEKATRLTDLGAASYPHMVCVEPANANENAVTLEPGETHAMGVTISVAPQ